MTEPSKEPTDLERDLKHIWHPCTQMKDHQTFPPLQVDRGEGAYLIDTQSNRYLDVISSWWVNLFGHNHPHLNGALEDQLNRVAHVMFAGITHRPAIDLAERLVELTPPNLTRVYFSDNGSTSVEVALKMSLQFWKQSGKPAKRKFIYLKDGYHGETLGALSVCGSSLFRDKFEDVLIPNREVAGPDCFRCPYGLKRETCDAECFEPMATALGEESEEVAGVIIEPLVQGAAGMKMYPPVYLRKLQDAAHQANVHVIYDEVAVGFGRTGDYFACSGNDLKPTFLCLSKGITSGYLPLAATLTEETIFDAFYDDFDTFKWFIHSHSYAANPLACSVANASLDLLTTDGFLEAHRQRIEHLNTATTQLQELPWCGEVRQTGFIAALELVADRNSKEPFPLEARVGYRIFQEGLKRGLFMRPLGNVVYFIPPYILNENDIETMINSAAESIRAVLGE